MRGSFAPDQKICSGGNKMNTKNRTSTSRKTTATDVTDAKRPSNLPQVDVGTAALMAVAGVVSGWMSYNGAAEIFNDDLMAFGFTIVVQGVVTLALWYFAVAKGMQRFLLAAVWSVAVTFSIGTAFVKTDKTNDGSVVAQAGVELGNYEAAIKAKILAFSAQAAEKTQEATAEAARGGCGPICRGLQDEANEMQSKADFYETSAGAAVAQSEAARAALSETADLAAMLAIYQTLQNGVGDLAEGIAPPDFINHTSRSAFDRIASAWDRLTNSDKELDVATLGAVWVACLMELLAVACSMIRLTSRLEPSDKPIKERAERIITWFYDLKHLPSRVTLLTKTAEDEWMRDNKPKAPASRSKAVGKKDDGSIKSDQEFWMEGLQAQAVKSDTPVETLILTMLDEQSTVTAQNAIAQKALGKYGTVLTALKHTGVVTHSKNGLVAGEKWADWTSFLFEENRRQRQQKAPSGSPRLRQVA
ncbi:MAG: hypothetical protein KDK08_00115 [Rhizobiaceae bacterium]|nr:hypothetical protein [Rhizobiaceae bacterium]